MVVRDGIDRYNGVQNPASLSVNSCLTGDRQVLGESVACQPDTARDSGNMQPRLHTLEFYKDDEGRKPVLEWIRKLDRQKRRALGVAMREILQSLGIQVCGTPFGRQLGQGLFEFRLREEDLLLRVFCHAYGDRVVLLLGGYDKGTDPSPTRQESEIEEARRRLRRWRQRSR